MPIRDKNRNKGRREGKWAQQETSTRRGAPSNRADSNGQLYPHHHDQHEHEGCFALLASLPQHQQQQQQHGRDRDILGVEDA